MIFFNSSGAPYEVVEYIQESFSNKSIRCKTSRLCCGSSTFDKVIEQVTQLSMPKADKLEAFKNDEKRSEFEFRSVSAIIDPCTMVCLVGGSSSGKTTLLRLLAR